MKINRDDLVEIIKHKVFRSKKKDIIDNIEEELTGSGKFTVLEFKNIRVGLTSLEDLNEAELYWIISVASKYIASIGLSEEYFTDVEIQNAKLYTKDAIENVEFPIVFENVENLTPNENKQFGFYLSVTQIAELKNSGLLEVVPELQRDGIKDKYGDLKVKVNLKRSSSIKNAMEAGEYFYDQIRINLVNDDDVNFEYNVEDRTLTIYSGTMIIPDGNHRTIACELSDLKNVNANNKYSVAFTVLTPMQTKELLAQTWNMEPISNRKKISMKITNSNIILDSVLRNQDLDPIFSKNVVRGEMGKNFQNGFILYDLLSSAIDKYYETYNIKTQEERIELAKWLVKYFNSITSLFIEDFKNPKKSHSEKWVVDPYAFIGYVILSRKFRYDENWKEKNHEVLNTIDFSNANSPIENRVVKKKEKSVDLFFKEVLKNV